MEGKFDGIYTNYISNKHDEWSEENQNKIEAYQKVRSQRTIDGENSNVKSGSGKSLTMSSQINSALCTDFGISHDDITKIIGIYNQSK